MVISKDELKSIVSARCGLPQEFLGMHKCKGGIVVRAYIVNAKSCHLVDLRKSARKSAEMETGGAVYRWAAGEYVADCRFEFTERRAIGFNLLQSHPGQMLY